MRIARFAVSGEVSFGIVEGGSDSGGEDGGEGQIVAAIDGHPFGPVRFTGQRYPLDQVRLLAPVLPSKVVAIGKNYADHAREMGGEPPASPIVFIKPSTSVVGPGDTIQYPVGASSEVHHEAELAVVIGRLCREVPPERAADVVLGYTCGNDVTARDVQRAEQQWGRAKGFDTFCPLGPWVETAVDPADLAITCTVGGDLRQAGRTKDMIRGVADLIAHISQAMTLLPGDVILTGTPAGVGPLRIGDEVAVSIEGIGTLANPVAARGGWAAPPPTPQNPASA